MNKTQMEEMACILTNKMQELDLLHPSFCVKISDYYGDKYKIIIHNIYHVFDSFKDDKITQLFTMEEIWCLQEMLEEKIAEKNEIRIANMRSQLDQFLFKIKENYNELANK